MNNSQLLIKSPVDILKYLESQIKEIMDEHKYDQQDMKLIISNYDKKEHPACMTKHRVHNVGLFLIYKSNTNNVSDYYIHRENEDENVLISDPGVMWDIEIYVCACSRSGQITPLLFVICDGIFRNCPKVMIEQRHVYQIESGIVIWSDLLATNVTINEYLEDEEGNVWICGDDVSPHTNDFVLQVLTAVGLIMSIISLVYTCILYCCFKHLDTRAGKLVMNLSLSLILADLIFITGGASVLNPKVCYAAAILNHYFWLVSFCWIAVLAWDIWKTFTCKLHGGHGSVSIRVQCFLSWGIPMIFVATTGLLDSMHILSMQYGEGVACWIGNRYNLIYFFVIPIIFIMLWNATFFILTLMIIHATIGITQMAMPPGGDNKKQLIIYIKIASLMGFTWIFGVLAVFFNDSTLSYLFVIFNSLQGVYIALAFGFNKQIRNKIAEKLVTHSTMVCYK